MSELTEAWDRAAWDNQVFPLDELTGLRWVQRPPWDLDGGNLAPGHHLVTLSVEAPGNLVCHASLAVDGATTGRIDGLTMLFAMAPFEGIDVGIDRRSPVSWDVYERRGPFPFTGAIRSVTYTPGELAPDAGRRWIDYLREVGARFE